jgi:alpha-mannosidase
VTPQAILLCGKLCAGKTTYARRLAPELGAVILSVDEIMLSLFKCPTDPNPVADQGEIVFTYSIYPHNGPFSPATVTKEAFLLNNPLTAKEACGDSDMIPATYSLISCDNEGVVVETVKEAEDGLDTIVRLYDNSNSKSNVTVKLGAEFSRCYLADLMENTLSELEIKDNKVALTINPFEIVTLKLEK